MSVRNALLGLLEQRSRHGYELRAAFEALVGGQQNWEVKPAQIYTTLARLEQSGLIVQDGVEQESGPERRVYSLTPAGREALHAWLATPVEAEHQRDEFFVKLMLTLATSQEDPYRLIYTQRASLYQELHDRTAQREEADQNSQLALILLLDQVIMHLEADLRWLDMIEARLDEMRRQPMPKPETRPRGRPKKAR